MYAFEKTPCVFLISHSNVDRVIESSSLEKTFKIIESNHQPDLPTPVTKPCPLVLNSRVLNTSRDGYSTTSLGSLTTLSMRKFFLASNLNIPWHMRTVPHILSLVT